MKFPKPFKPRLVKENEMSVEKSKEVLNHEYAMALAQLGQLHYTILKSQDKIKELTTLVDNLQIAAESLNTKVVATQEAPPVSSPQEIPPSV